MIFQTLILVIPAAIFLGSFFLFRADGRWDTTVLLIGSSLLLTGQLLQYLYISNLGVEMGTLAGSDIGEPGDVPGWPVPFFVAMHGVGILAFIIGFLSYAIRRRAERSRR